MSEDLLYETSIDCLSFSGPKIVIRVYKNRLVFWGTLSEGKFIEKSEYITLLFKNIKNIRYIERNRTLLGRLLPFLEVKPKSWLYITTYDGKNYVTVEHEAQAEIHSAYELLIGLL